jgi:hypothetical protein
MPLIAPIFCASKILIPAFEEVPNRWASYPQLSGSADEALSFYECTFSLECFIYLLNAAYLRPCLPSLLIRAPYSSFLHWQALPRLCMFYAVVSDRHIPEAPDLGVLRDAAASL